VRKSELDQLWHVLGAVPWDVTEQIASAVVMGFLPTEWKQALGEKTIAEFQQIYGIDGTDPRFKKLPPELFDGAFDLFAVQTGRRSGRPPGTPIDASLVAGAIRVLILQGDGSCPSVHALMREFNLTQSSIEDRLRQWRKYGLHEPFNKDTHRREAGPLLSGISDLIHTDWATNAYAPPNPWMNELQRMYREQTSND
jgi:hypothetical protein